MAPFLDSSNGTGVRNALLHGAFLSCLQSFFILQFGLGLHTPHGSTQAISISGCGGTQIECDGACATLKSKIRTFSGRTKSLTAKRAALYHNPCPFETHSTLP